MVLAVKPPVSVGTTKPRTPSSVRAQITATSAMLPLVIHILVPLRIQSVPSRLATVRMLAGSDPESGSVRPKQPIENGRASCRERVCQDVYIPVGADSFKKK